MIWRAIFQITVLTFFLLGITACDGNNFAPVTDISHIETFPTSGIHRVTKGEKLYGVAWRYGLDHRTPETTKPLMMVGSMVQRRQWLWPVEGKVIAYFSTHNKGINIAGRQGVAIHAIREGKVVYAGNGLRGYGHLIIIKHNQLYLSAYAHNQRILVKEGDWIQKGQKIAEMGSSGTHTPMLHFEVRRAGKPIDPLLLY